MKNYSFGRHKYLNYDEFVNFFYELDDREDVRRIFRVINKYREYMDYRTFHDFIVYEQKVIKLNSWFYLIIIIIIIK